MRSLNNSSHDDQPSLFSGMCKSSEFEPFIHKNETEAVKTPCAGRARANIVSCQDEGIDQFLEEVGGLSLETVSIVNSIASLPSFIPIIPKGMFMRPSEEIPNEVVGVILGDILTTKVRPRLGQYRFPKTTSVDRNLLNNPVFKNKKVVLFSAGQDVLIETLWWKRNELEFFKTISEMGFYAVTGMNFSLISGECPFGHALNMKKSAVYCKNFDCLGTCSIPHIYAVNQFQRQRWAKWLIHRPSIKTVTINTQLQRKQETGMANSFETIAFLLENTNVNIIIHGRIKGLPLEVQQKYAERLHYAASNPLKNALIRKDKTPSEYIKLFLFDLNIPMLVPIRR